MIRIMVMALAIMTSTHSFADGRWFEIEVMVFTQPADGSTETLRNDDVELDNYGFDKDLLTPAYLATLGERCLSGDIAPPPRNNGAFSMFTDNSAAQSNDCSFASEDLAGQSPLPIEVIVPEQEHTDTPYLLSPSQLQFTDKRAELKRKGRQVLLHSGWRFPGQAKRQAPRYRLFAGKAVALDAQEQNIASPSPFFPSKEVVYDPIWELDGFLKVHLNHYLYITSNLITRHTGDTDSQVSAEFSQFRRVISGEIHYFDHPQIGMLVQIRRFNH